MIRSARIVGRNRDHVLYGWLKADGDWRFAYPEPLQCASEAQAHVAIAKWRDHGIIIAKLPGERMERARVPLLEGV